MLGLQQSELAILLVRRLARSGNDGFYTLWKIVEHLGPAHLPELLEALAKSRSAAYRHQLLRILGSVGDLPLAHFHKQLDDRRVRYVRDFVWLMAELRRPELGPLLHAAAGHADAKVRREAVSGLALLPDDSSELTLLKALADSALEVRVAALRVLRQRFSNGSQALLVSYLSLPNWNGRNTRLIAAAARALGQLGDASALPELTALTHPVWLFRRRRRAAGKAAETAIRNIALSAQQSASATLQPEDSARAPERDSRENVLVELGRHLLCAQQSHAIYPKEHPRTVAAMGDLHFRTVELLAEEGDLSFALVDGEFVFDNEPLAINGEVLRGLAQLLHRQGIGRLAVLRGVRRWELTLLVEALNVRPEALEANGGIEAFLNAKGAERVEAAPLTGNAVSTERVGDVPTLSSAWEVYSANLENMRALKSRLDEGIDQEAVEEAVSLAGELAEVVAAQPQSFALLYALKSHDDYSYTHSLNVAMLSLTIAQWLEFPADTLAQIAAAAILHDIGKVLVPSEVLNKPGKLTDDEWEIMQLHGDDGARLLLESPVSDLAFVVAYEHQLAYDEQHADFGRWPIHLVSEIICLADVYDALRSTRPYRDALSPDVAMRIMEEEAEQKFDIELFAGFRRMLGYYPAGTCVRLHDGSIAVAHAANLGDPERPRVLVVRDANGQDKEPPESVDLASAALEVDQALAPEVAGIDPVDYL